MSVFATEAEERDARGFAALPLTNPFLHERIELEKSLLGESFVASGSVWHRSEPEDLPNLELLGRRAEELSLKLRSRLDLRSSNPLPPNEASRVRAVFLYHFYQRTLPDLRALVEDPSKATRPLRFWPRFRDEATALLQHRALDAAPNSHETDPAHLLAIFYQVRRAFQHAFEPILGGSLAAARLRAAIWESIFTHDLERYRKGLFDRMRLVATLVTGPSGTGKELVARAIARSGFIPFDAIRGCFVADESDLFRGLHLASLSPTLVEAELFGARKGAYTGAVEDRVGWFESCPEWGGIFLDEVGEVAPTLQVKLLRLLQTRRFSRLGETERKTFGGKVLAATNRDLDLELQRGRLRQDFYYRLSADRIETPTLAEQLREDPEELRSLLRGLAARFLEPEDAESVAEETWAWIGSSLPADYPWPGNFRELEQCLRSVLVRGHYRPATLREIPRERLEADLRGLRWTSDQLLDLYCHLVTEETGSFSAAGRRLGLDRRTVRARAGAHVERERADGRA